MDTSRVSDVQRAWEYLTLATFLLKPNKTSGDASFTLSLISQSSPLSPLACLKWHALRSPTGSRTWT